MTLPVYASPISLLQIQTEFGGANPISLGEYYAGGNFVEPGSVGVVAGVVTNIPSGGPISFGNFHSAQQTFYFYDTVSSDVNDYNLYNRAVAAGWTTRSLLYAQTTVNGGVKVINMDSGLYTAKLQRWTIYNYGTIMGAGGPGGAGASLYNPAAGNGQRGVTAIISYAPLTNIANYGSILGGGGGGGGGGALYASWRSSSNGAQSDASLTGGGGGAGATAYTGAFGTPSGGSYGTVSGGYASAQYIIYSGSGSSPAIGSTTGGSGGGSATFGTTYYDPTTGRTLILQAGAGGRGGDAGEDGQDGAYFNVTAGGASGWYSLIPRDPGLGSIAGLAVSGTSVRFIDPSLNNSIAIGDVRGGISTPANGYGILYGALGYYSQPRTGWYNAFLAASTAQTVFDPYILISFNPDGTISTGAYNTANQFGMLTGDNAFWYARDGSPLQATPNVGRLFYIKVTSSFGNDTFSTLSGMTVGQWHRLDSARSLQLRRLGTATGQTNASITVTIETSRGASLLQSTITMQVTVT